MTGKGKRGLMMVPDQSITVAIIRGYTKGKISIQVPPKDDSQL